MFYSPSEGLHCPRSHWVHNQAETGISFIQPIHVPDFSSDFIRMMVMAIMGDNPSPSAFHALPVHWWVCGECCACVCGTVTRRLHVSTHGPGAGRLGSPPTRPAKSHREKGPWHPQQELAPSPRKSFSYFREPIPRRCLWQVSLYQVVCTYGSVWGFWAGWLENSSTDLTSMNLPAFDHFCHSHLHTWVFSVGSGLCRSPHLYSVLSLHTFLRNSTNLSPVASLFFSLPCCKFIPFCLLPSFCRLQEGGWKLHNLKPKGFTSSFRAPDPLLNNRDNHTKCYNRLK